MEPNRFFLVNQKPTANLGLISERMALMNRFFLVILEPTAPAA